MRPWTITWTPYDHRTTALLEPVTWTDDSLTVADAVAVQLLIGTEQGWSALDPWAGPLQLSSIIVAMSVRALNPTEEESAACMAAQIALIRQLSLEQIMSVLEERKPEE